MWISAGDPADTNDSDKQTVDRPVAVCGEKIFLNRLIAYPYRDDHCMSSRAPTRDPTTNAAPRDPGVRRDDEMHNSYGSHVRDRRQRLPARSHRDPLHVIPGPRPGISPPMPHPEIPAFAGMTKCTIRTVLTYGIVDNGSLRARIGTPCMSSRAPDPGSHHQCRTPRSRRSPG